MTIEEKFVSISGLICEPTRAKMLWNLLDGRAYTASELALVADISATSASNHLSKLLKANVVKVDSQGRHRYYSFSTPDVAYVVESLANLAGKRSETNEDDQCTAKSGVAFCRTCYDHLAGYVGVQVAAALENEGHMKPSDSAYWITEQGWEWAAAIGIMRKDFENSRRPWTRKCLDWSERKPHVAGQFGAAFLSKGLHRKWLKRVQFSRELVVTVTGQKELNELLSLRL